MKHSIIFAALATFAAFALLIAAETGGPATYVEHGKVSALFAGKGGAIAKGPDFSVSANKRMGPGQVEVHEKETDVFHVMDGEATLVTGGKMIGGKLTRPEQWLGTSIEGGTTYHLSKGDVVTVPAGTPHWFKEVPSGISYYTVKIIKP
jgi:mannose-6-phosphate isomerase-like protein (cupin superfamily)